ncbi:helix-turn-helix transcriptional regulator [Nocardia sp. NPDC059180]|uniref:helix-turn-helix transcriptional regulator n=1 Tax=Nocardia sp. NPDC059180 TaxID=3346761 RepID=UPI003692373A
MSWHEAGSPNSWSPRAELRPGDLGLPEGRRRRTPGLRREEVAVLAGVSADYLARLEQGRDNNPSPAVVEALADALLLRGEARYQFNILALTAADGTRCPGGDAEPEHVPETVQQVLRALAPTPAFVVGRQLNVLDWNSAWADFAAPLGLLDDASPNLARFTFTHPAAYRVLRNWQQAADAFAAALNRAMVRWPADDKLRDTIDTLRRHPAFAERWTPQRLNEPTAALLRFDHPALGEVDVPFETLETTSDQSLVVWLTDRVQATGLHLVRDRAANE